jgi:membrane-associated phospholipid phosphatase
MKLTFALILFSSLTLPFDLFAQATQPDQPPAGSPSPAPPQAPPTPPTAQTKQNYERPISWKLLLPNLLSDQVRIWTFPARLVQGQGVLPTAAVLGTAVGLGAADPEVAGDFRRSTVFHGFNNVFTSNATAVGTIVAPVSMFAVGLIRKDQKMQKTAMLAGEAAADAEVVVTVLKEVARRQRPSSIPTHGNFSDSWYESNSGSFPSGHTIVAFSIATVVARRYGNHRWVPYAAYGAAALVGFSRLSLSAHFLSDVFMGGVLGYSIGRFSVLRQ